MVWGKERREKRLEDRWKSKEEKKTKGSRIMKKDERGLVNLLFGLLALFARQDVEVDDAVFGDFDHGKYPNGSVRGHL